jgi:acetoin utilization deacetylase AcuC-like enzyme
MAAAVRYAQRKGFRKILIIDWDFHHGDGTQDIFKHDGTVHTLSTHSILDLYMAAVRATKRGTTYYSSTITEDTNIPITKKQDPEMIAEIGLQGDFYPNTQSLSVFKEKLNGLSFRPDLIFIFDGMDAHREDVSRDAIGWDNDDFEKLMKTVLDFAGRHGSPVIASPGGSYRGGLAFPILRRHCKLMQNY